MKSLRMPVEVHSIADAHWPAAMTLLTGVFVGEGFTAPAAGARSFRRETIESAGTLLGATDGPDLLGVVLLLERTSPLAQIAREGETEIRMLAVSPAARGCGIGESLVSACIDGARAPRFHATSIVLCTQPTMRAAQRLYERTGFVRRPDRDFIVPRPPAYDPSHGSLERLFYVRAL